ncbi:MAG: 50S ribosomal protein L30 [Tissierellia bacterium]|nr:50S ribosomal protein L30 [Tissierellia bacterium]
METLKIKLVRSLIGKTEKQKNIIKSLGFTKIGQVKEHKDTPQLRGLMRNVEHMIEIVD